MDRLTKKHAEKARFVLVGAANTAIDFGLLLLLTGLGLNKIPANYISTTVAFLFSFVANKNYTFGSKDKNTKKEFILFTIVTLFGLWVIQPIVIFISGALLASVISNDQTLVASSKLIATGASLVWNYVFYSRLVFKKVS